MKDQARQILERASRLRAESPLCDASFKDNHEKLPRVTAPSWMVKGMGLSFLGVIFFTGIILLSPMEEFVTCGGMVRAGDYTLVFSKEAGLLEAIEVRDGEAVTEGQVLARLESWDVDRELTRLDSAMREADIELELARSTARKVTAVPAPPEFLFSAVEVERQREIQGLQQDYLRRLEELEQSGAASSVELLNLRLQLIATEALLKRNEQARDLLEGDFGQAAADEAAERVRLLEARRASLEKEKNLLLAEKERLIIRAPRDGFILAISRVFIGEKIEPGFALFKISHGPGTELRLYATEDRIDRIKPGQLVRFRANNNPDRLAPMATGRVVEVARDLELSTNDPDIAQPNDRQSYRVKVKVENEPYPLTVGVTVQAEIVLGQRPFWQLLLLRNQDDS
jgi:multidrug efflux pump subunit AcrA (membrane-fusion protein)